MHRRSVHRQPEPTPFAAVAEAGRAARGWEVIPIATGPDAMITAPNEPAGALLATTAVCGKLPDMARRLPDS